MLENEKAIEIGLVMKIVPTFVKTLWNYFFDMKAKVKNGGRACAKFHVLHDCPLDDLAKVLKEETNNLRLYVREHVLANHFTVITRLFAKLCAEVDLINFK